MIKNNQRQLTFFFFFSCWLLLSVTAGFRTPGFDRDSIIYIEMMNRSIDQLWLQEPTFIAIVLINRFLFDGDYETFFLAYALIGIGIKIIAIRRLPAYQFIAFIVYVALYFALHDLTQIRVGVASGFFLLSLTYIPVSRKKAFLLQCMAALFHYSAILGFCTLLFSAKKINKFFFGSVVILSIAISKFLTQDFLLSIINHLPDFLSLKLTSYIIGLNSTGLFETFNQYNFYHLGQAVLFFILLFKIKERNNDTTSALMIICTKVIAVAIVSYYILAPVPIFAGRISEFFGIAMIIFIPMVISLLRPQWLSAGVLLIFVLIQGIRLTITILTT
ncbi:EpsG family protein [Jejubacter calystegiae]|uniref:EpsG family protein n=1 Tax=Jejubacter calystegiae TaxID=2579935 RepID=A0A4P8YT47_9ENTR|nr:EpsG family protein [Jejubacter calystegiae]QCT22032.1 EpsG family protein [Jejubacter calystegiae]